MNNTRYRWKLLSGGDINSRGLCEADVICCPECHYTTNPQIVKWEYNGNTYGKATVPRICPKCHALMEVEHEDDYDYERASDMRDYCERYEPTYNPEDGSM